MSAPTHVAAASELARREPVRCVVLTVSDTRTADTDLGGNTVVHFVESAGHAVIERAIVRDEPGDVRAALERWIADPRAQAILCTGGTGIGRRDGTVEVVRALLTVELDGFGELFRVLSYEAVGSPAMLSRAVAGLVVRGADAGGDTLLFAMPGSVNAVETAMSRLIAPELAHLVWERRR